MEREESEPVAIGQGADEDAEEPPTPDQAGADEGEPEAAESDESEGEPGAAGFIEE